MRRRAMSQRSVVKSDSCDYLKELGIRILSLQITTNRGGKIYDDLFRQYVIDNLEPTLTIYGSAQCNDEILMEFDKLYGIQVREGHGSNGDDEIRISDINADLDALTTVDYWWNVYDAPKGEITKDVVTYDYKIIKVNVNKPSSEWDVEGVYFDRDYSIPIELDHIKSGLTETYIYAVDVSYEVSFYVKIESNSNFGEAESLNYFYEGDEDIVTIDVHFSTSDTISLATADGNFELSLAEINSPYAQMDPQKFSTIRVFDKFKIPLPLEVSNNLLLSCGCEDDPDNDEYPCYDESPIGYNDPVNTDNGQTMTSELTEYSYGCIELGEPTNWISSYDELKLIYDNRDEINELLEYAGSDTIDFTKEYWTSVFAEYVGPSEMFAWAFKEGQYFRANTKESKSIISLETV